MSPRAGAKAPATGVKAPAATARPTVEPGRRTPILIVSGFLGSGKTTLVRSLLEQSQRDGVRLAVISNEFGALGIDEALLAGGPTTVELAGGCVCCQLSDALVETLVRLHQTVDPDRIVIETSGLALPGETQLHLYRPAVRDWLGDEACVVVVDATGSALAALAAAGDPDERAAADPTFEQQVQSADLVLISKGDLAPPDAMAARVRALAPDTPIIPVVRGAIPIAALFPSGPGRAEPAEHAGHAHAGHEHAEHAGHAHAEHAHAEHAHAEHAHAQGWTSGEQRVPPGLAPEAIEARLLGLGAVRIKGFVDTTDGIRLVQGVGRRIELVPPPGPVPDALLGRVVVIARIRPG